MMLDLDDVYVFDHAMKRTALHVALVDYQDVDTQALQLGEVAPVRSLVYKYDAEIGGGSRPYDVITATPFAYLVSARLVGVLHSFTGWATYPVRVTGKKGESLPSYHGLAVTGRCGPIDRVMGRRLWRDRPARGPFTYNRRYYYFDPASWDGSDFFCTQGPGGFMVVGQLARALKKAKITNLELWRLPEY